MSGRISALKNKIAKLENKNNYLVLKNMIIEDISNKDMEKINQIRHDLQARKDVINSKDKEIMKLKQEQKHRQAKIDALQMKLDDKSNDLIDAYALIDAQKRELESKKFTNRVKKIFGN